LILDLGEPVHEITRTCVLCELAGTGHSYGLHDHD